MSSSSSAAPDAVTHLISCVQASVAEALASSMRPHLDQLKADLDTTQMLKSMLLQLPEHKALQEENLRLKQRLGEADPAGILLEVRDTERIDSVWSENGSSDKTCVADVQIEDLCPPSLDQEVQDGDNDDVLVALDGDDDNDEVLSVTESHAASEEGAIRVDSDSEPGDAVDEEKDLGEEGCEDEADEVKVDEDENEEGEVDADEDEADEIKVDEDDNDEVQVDANEDDAGESEEDEEEEEYYTVLIAMPDGEREFFTNDAKNGEICEVTADGDIGETVGKFVKGRAVLD